LSSVISSNKCLFMYVSVGKILKTQQTYKIVMDTITSLSKEALTITFQDV